MNIVSHLKNCHCLTHFISTCVCVCVCETERKRESMKKCVAQVHVSYQYNVNMCRSRMDFSYILWQFCPLVLTVATCMRVDVLTVGRGHCAVSWQCDIQRTWCISMAQCVFCFFSIIAYQFAHLTDNHTTLNQLYL